MGQYKLKIYAVAQQDLLDIVDYLNTLSSQAAIRYYDLIVEKIAGLAEMPERCPQPRDTQLRLRGYRYLLVEKYVVFFVIKGNVAQIRRILYGKRNYGLLL